MFGARFPLRHHSQYTEGFTVARGIERLYHFRIHRRSVFVYDKLYDDFPLYFPCLGIGWVSEIFGQPFHKLHHAAGKVGQFLHYLEIQRIVIQIGGDGRQSCRLITRVGVFTLPLSLMSGCSASVLSTTFILSDTVFTRLGAAAAIIFFCCASGISSASRFMSSRAFWSSSACSSLDVYSKATNIRESARISPKRNPVRRVFSTSALCAFLTSIS